MGSEGTIYATGSGLPSLAGTSIVTVTSSTTFYLNITITFSSGSITVGGVPHLTAIRVG